MIKWASLELIPVNDYSGPFQQNSPLTAWNDTPLMFRDEEEETENEKDDLIWKQKI